MLSCYSDTVVILCVGGNRADHENEEDAKTPTSAGGGVITAVEQIQAKSSCHQGTLSSFFKVARNSFFFQN